MAKITEAEFARYATSIASRAASWAGECLMIPEYFDRPMNEDALRRFTESIAGVLSRINEDHP